MKLRYCKPFHMWPICTPTKLEVDSISLLSPFSYTLTNFPSLTHKLDATPNFYKMKWQYSHCSLISLPKTKSSSTNEVWFIETKGENMMPSKLSMFFSFVITLLKPSITRIKINGDREHPWRRMHKALNNLEGIPLMMIKYLMEEMQDMIQLMLCRDMSILSITTLMKDQSMLSYALHKSTCIIRDSIFLVWIEWRTSWAYAITSWMDRLGRKPYFSTDIYLDKTPLMQTTMIFEEIL